MYPTGHYMGIFMIGQLLHHWRELTFRLSQLAIVWFVSQAGWVSPIAGREKINGFLLDVISFVGDDLTASFLADSLRPDGEDFCGTLQAIADWQEGARVSIDDRQRRFI